MISAVDESPSRDPHSPLARPQPSPVSRSSSTGQSKLQSDFPLESDYPGHASFKLESDYPPEIKLQSDFPGHASSPSKDAGEEGARVDRALRLHHLDGAGELKERTTQVEPGHSLVLQKPSSSFDIELESDYPGQASYPGHASSPSRAPGHSRVPSERHKPVASDSQLLAAGALSSFLLPPAGARVEDGSKTGGAEDHSPRSSPPPRIALRQDEPAESGGGRSWERRGEKAGRTHRSPAPSRAGGAVDRASIPDHASAPSRAGSASGDGRDASLIRNRHPEKGGRDGGEDAGERRSSRRSSLARDGGGDVGERRSSRRSSLARGGEEDGALACVRTSSRGDLSSRTAPLGEVSDACVRCASLLSQRGLSTEV